MDAGFHRGRDLSSKHHRKAIERCSPPSCGVVANISHAEWSVSNVRVMKVGGLGMPRLVYHRHASRLAFLRRALTEDSNLEGSVREVFTCLTVTPPFPRTDRRRNSKK